MILTMLAAAALTQWTGPRTEEYKGPGYFCGGGYAVHLTRGERALILPQGQAPQATRLVLSGGEVNILTGAHREPGKVVLWYGGSAVTEQNDDGGGVTYIVSDQTPYGLRVTSGAFRGFKRDGWFFAKAKFAAGADERVQCLSAFSY
jgi:hypothetical protein